MIRKTITLSKEQIGIGNLLLVNAEYPLHNAGKADLIPVDTRFPGVLMKREAAHVLELVLEKIGCTDQIVPVSGYRSAKEQTEIYADTLKTSGEEFTRKFVALPNHSEHQTGLAIDLGLKKDEIDFICPEFPYEGICDAFRKLAPRYGFIERYPEQKEQLTGIAQEPWHFRYVGYPHSEIMQEQGLVLEEYIAYLRQFPQNGSHLQTCRNGLAVEIFYAAAGEAETTEIKLPENTVYQVSGNNAEGFVVTLWRNAHEQS